MSRDFITFDGFEVAIDLDRWPAKILRALLRRHYEKHELRLVSRLLEPHDRIIELGNAIGVVALAASRTVPAGQIACFDANPDMVAEAEANFLHNGHSITARNAVLVADGPAPATVTFYKTPYFLSSSLSPDTAGASPVEVPTSKLSEAISARDANVLIVDIEGGEFDLLGATDLTAIDNLVLEIHVSMAGVGTCLMLISDLRRQGLELDTGLTGHNVFVFTRGGISNAPQGQSEAFAAAYLKALEASDRGDRTGAIDAVTRAIDASPHNAHAHLLLSQLVISDGPLNVALKEAEAAAHLDPLNEDAFEQLGVLHSALGDLGAAEAAYTRAIALVPHRPLFHMGRGAVLARQGRGANATADFRAAVALCPARAATTDHLIDLAGRRDKAPEDTASAPPVPVSSREFLRELAGIVSHSFRFPDAGSALAIALEAEPDDQSLHCGLAVLVATPKDIRKALKSAP